MSVRDPLRTFRRLASRPGWFVVICPWPDPIEGRLRHRTPAVRHRIAGPRSQLYRHPTEGHEWWDPYPGRVERQCDPRGDNGETECEGRHACCCVDPEGDWSDISITRSPYRGVVLNRQSYPQANCLGDAQKNRGLDRRARQDFTIPQQASGKELRGLEIQEIRHDKRPPPFRPSHPRFHVLSSSDPRKPQADGVRGNGRFPSAADIPRDGFGAPPVPVTPLRRNPLVIPDGAKAEIGDGFAR